MSITFPDLLIHIRTDIHPYLTDVDALCLINTSKSFFPSFASLYKFKFPYVSHEAVNLCARHGFVVDPCHIRNPFSVCIHEGHEWRNLRVINADDGSLCCTPDQRKEHTRIVFREYMLHLESLRMSCEL
jgi:hypothetical protein